MLNNDIETDKYIINKNSFYFKYNFNELIDDYINIIKD